MIFFLILLRCGALHVHCETHLAVVLKYQCWVGLFHLFIPAQGSLNQSKHHQSDSNAKMWPEIPRGDPNQKLLEEQRAGFKLPLDGSGGAGIGSKLEAFGSNWVLKGKKSRFKVLLCLFSLGVWGISSGTRILQRRPKMWGVLIVRAG